MVESYRRCEFRYQWSLFFCGNQCRKSCIRIMCHQWLKTILKFKTHFNVYGLKMLPGMLYCCMVYKFELFRQSGQIKNDCISSHPPILLCLTMYIFNKFQREDMLPGSAKKNVSHRLLLMVSVLHFSCHWSLYNGATSISSLNSGFHKMRMIRSWVYPRQIYGSKVQLAT